MKRSHDNSQIWRIEWNNNNPHHHLEFIRRISHIWFRLFIMSKAFFFFLQKKSEINGLLVTSTNHLQFSFFFFRKNFTYLAFFRTISSYYSSIPPLHCICVHIEDLYTFSHISADIMFQEYLYFGVVFFFSCPILFFITKISH